MPRAGSRILLLGGDADHNVGDRAIVEALVRCLTQVDPAADISIVGQPELLSDIAGVSRVIPRGARGFGALLRAAARADRVVIAGGGLFQDDDSRAKMPYWAARIGLLKACRARVSALSIGAGPLAHPESRSAARLASRGLERISVRDRPARDALAACTDRPIPIVPDPAFMLEPAPRSEAEAQLRRIGIAEGRSYIVATLRRWYHARGGLLPNGLKARFGFAPERDHERFDALLGVLARSLDALRRKLDADILLLPGYNTALEGDDAACEALRLRLPGAPVHVARIASPRLYKALLGRASLVISARMHPLILGAGMGVPFVGLSYNAKFDGLYELLGLPARALPLDQCPDGWGESTLIAAAERALAADADLGQRAAALADAVRLEARAVAFGEAAHA
jgi:polysaccharide pyruvyl transferase WcaK-like protein